jgi:hypothetical protein
MQMLNIPPGLRTKSGQDASEGLVDMFAQYHEFATDRFERRLAELRGDFDKTLAEGLAQIRVEMANMRADVIRWNLVFWVGQFAAMVAALSIMLDGR